MYEENGSFVKLRTLSDHIFSLISSRVKKNTGYPLIKIGDFRYSYVENEKGEVLRIDSTHNGHKISFIVTYESDILLSVEKHKTEYLKEINYVSDFLISYIKNGYIHPINKVN
jgi:hypothetical protein